MTGLLREALPRPLCPPPAPGTRSRRRRPGDPPGRRPSCAEPSPAEPSAGGTAPPGEQRAAGPGAEARGRRRGAAGTGARPSGAAGLGPQSAGSRAPPRPREVLVKGSCPPPPRRAQRAAGARCGAEGSPVPLRPVG